MLSESFGVPEPLDLLGVSLITAGITALVWALVLANDVGWASPEVAWPIVGGLLLVAAFFAWEVRAPHPALPPRLLRSRVFAGGNLAGLVMGASFAVAFFIVQYFQFALGYSPFESGLRLLPYFVTPAIVSPWAGLVSRRIGGRTTAVGGLGLQAVALAAVVTLAGAHTSYVELAVALFLSGVGVSLAMPPVATAVISAVAREEIGKASAVYTTLQRFGTVLGIALGTALFTGVGSLASPAKVTSGAQAALVMCAALASAAGLLAALLNEDRRGPHRAQSVT